jgi:hypothetical protein
MATKRMPEDLTGRRYGRWLVLSFSHRKKSTSYWLCRCDCGTERVVIGTSLNYGSSRCCGCLSPANMRCITHGAKKGGKPQPEYNVWINMRQRCCNPNRAEYPRYGGRGITVCPEWLNDFAQFIADMGPKPSPQHSIERRDNNLGYSKDNCVWETGQVQANNKRNTVFVTVDGKRMSLPDACRKLSISYNMVRRRRALGWPEHRWFEPVGHIHLRPYPLNGCAESDEITDTGPFDGESV